MAARYEMTARIPGTIDDARSRVVEALGFQGFDHARPGIVDRSWDPGGHFVACGHDDLQPDRRPPPTSVPEPIASGDAWRPRPDVFESCASGSWRVGFYNEDSIEDRVSRTSALGGRQGKGAGTCRGIGPILADARAL